MLRPELEQLEQIDGFIDNIRYRSLTRVTPSTTRTRSLVANPGRGRATVDIEMVGVRASGRQPARGSSLAIDRIARRAYIATEIEHRLEMAGVRLVVADEPAMPASGGRKAETAPQRVHEALVSLETFVQAQEISAHRERSRSTPGLSPDPQAKRVYPLRSFILCDLCGRRMFGNTRRETVSYACNPKKASRPLSTRSPRGSEKITCSAA